MSLQHYDVIVIGGGASGLTCALGLVRVGKKVLIIEQDKMGGECTWSGCVPSKAFIQYSKEISVDKNSIFQNISDISKRIYNHESPTVLESYGIDVIQGEASFYDSHTISVGSQKYYGDNIVICTGSHAFIPPIQGLDSKYLLTNANFFTQDQLPESIVFIGAGVISIELSIPLARLGVKVTILEKSIDILFTDDEHSKKFIKNTLEKYNITLITDVNIQKCEIQENNKIAICYTKQEQFSQVLGEKVFIAVGRQPNIKNLNLDIAKIEYTEQGILVDEYMQTSQAHIYSAGDVVVGKYKFAHVAGMQGKVIVHNIIESSKKKYDVGEIPSIIFTEPEYAQVGLSETKVKEIYGDDFKIYKYFQEDCERAIMGLDREFYIKLIVHNKYIVGAYVIGSKAGEIANIFQFFYASKTSIEEFSTIIQPYPTYGDFIRKIVRKISEECKN
ncbi:MAG: dihydrolipoyl dehydrogenase family protein [Brevinema sp.]